VNDAGVPDLEEEDESSEEIAEAAPSPAKAVNGNQKDAAEKAGGKSDRHRSFPQMASGAAIERHLAAWWKQRKPAVTTAKSVPAAPASAKKN
jgi:hypothetical protein